MKLIGALLLSALASWGITLDLAPTGYSQFTSISNSSQDRGIYFDVTTGFSIAEAGIWMDPLAGGATSLELSIYSANSLTLGTLLASATAAVTDSGLALYNVPLNYTFSAGQQYYLSFNAAAPAGGFGTTNDLRFFVFNAGSGHPAYNVGGVLNVLDGALAGSAPNFVMPHLVLNTEVSGGGGGGGGGAVPEPSTYVLLGSALALPALRRYLGRR